MRHFTIFFKKEITENIKTYKLMIILVVFCFFGLMSPIIAKYTPDLLKSALPNNILLNINEPTWVDSWEQFFKNISQIGSILIIGLFIGIMSREYQNNSLINLVTKGVSRTSIILSKFASSLVIVTISLVASLIITIIYTNIYFDHFINSEILYAVFCLYIFYCYMLSLLLFVSTISKKESSGFLLFCLLMLPLFFIRIFPKTNDYNPLTLVFSNMDIIKKTLTINDLISPIIASVAVMIIFLYGSIYIFNKREF